MTTKADVVTHLTRSEVWSSQIKEVLEDELMAQKYVDWLDEFPDGDQFNIPSIGQGQLDDYQENQDINYHALDTGEFTFAITEYKSSGNYITNKAKQDMFYMNQLVSSFVPKQSRAIMEGVEADVFACPLPSSAGGQTVNDLNTINGASHRFVGSGTNETIAVKDFALAKYALDKANVPYAGRVAIVDPSVGYTLSTAATLISDFSRNAKWEAIMEGGLSKDMAFVANISGFDIYESNRLADANETINSLTTTAGKQNLFFNAMPDLLPFVGAWRQMPMVDSEYNKDKQREEYVTTARYGVKLYRPENMVCVLTDTDQVS